MNTILLTLLITSTFQWLQAFTKTASEWKSRSVYQIITDRFARTDIADTTACADLGNYCGGTFRGIQNNLEYIQGMGFDAIWISPVVANTPGGYHGYWISNLYEINENFGTPEELKELISACHEKDIWIMVDVVANHVGYVNNGDFTSIIPFSDPSHYNTYVDCADVDPRDQQAYETCWLSGLPDLDQNNQFVRDTLLAWASDFVQTYDIDAFRIDTVPHVSREFWSQFSKEAGVFTVGEILNFDLPYLASYQGSVDSVLNYALYSTLRYAFQTGGSMNSVETYYEGAYSTYPDVTVLGNFVNNHDNPRFLSTEASSVQAFKAALAFTIASVGIPMVYYGDEQAFAGGMDPANRETLWTGMSTESEIYQFIKTLNNFRRDTQFFNLEQVQRFSDDNVYAFTRGEYFFAFTNSQEQQTRAISFHGYLEGTLLCNLFYEDDCVRVDKDGFELTLLNGEVKILRPRIIEEKELSIEKKDAWISMRMMISSASASM